MRRAGKPRVVGVVGRSGTGKTSLLERLIPALESRGLAVGVVKHASHGFDADRPGKDSHRLYGSGARAVALASGEALATFRRRTGPAPVRLAEALATLPEDLDLVLVEGFSWEPIPRVVLVRESEDPVREHLAPGEVLHLVRVAEPPARGRPEFPDGLVESIAGAIAAAAPASPARLRPLAAAPLAAE